MEEDFLKELVKIAEGCGAYILSDEVYKSLETGIEVPSIADLYDKGISVNSISKTYSVPGIRIGWVVANSELSDIFRKYRDYTMICAGVFDDYLATYILENKEAVLERNRKIASAFHSDRCRHFCDGGGCFFEHTGGSCQSFLTDVGGQRDLHFPLEFIGEIVRAVAGYGGKIRSSQDR